MPETASRDPLLRSAPVEPHELEDQIHLRLSTRLNQNSKYTVEEVRRITDLDRSLFPKDFAVSKETSDNLRALANLSQCQLKPAREIRSHRKLLGPVIVALKKLTWPLIKVHLNDTFEGLQEFCSRMVYSHAKQILETERLKQRLEESRKE